MNEQQKISIRFFDDREVRALWDEQNAKWWFSVLDIVAVLTDQNDYTKTRNYWKYLKAKLKKKNSEVVSATTQLKLLAPDGKKRFSDMLDYNGIIALGKQSICKSLLTPLDHYELALKHKVTDDESEKVFQGFKMIKDQLNKALEDEGVSIIDALNEEYDPNFHQAIMTEKVEDVEPNVVLEVLQKGYMFKDRLIRPAIVKISE